MTNKDVILRIDPPLLKFPFELEKEIPCSLHLSNLTDMSVAFKIQPLTTNLNNYRRKKSQGILPPRATWEVVVTMKPLLQAPPEMRCKDMFRMLSVIVNGRKASKKYTPKLFSEKSKYVHEKMLYVMYMKPPKPLSPVREASDEESSTNAVVSDNGYLITSEFGNEPKVASHPEKLSSEGTAKMSQQSSQDESTEEESQRINIGLTSIFGYDELQEATKFFNPSEVVGEGRFGIVYRGKLGDGRTVAVKDLHVHHPKWMEQFLNEVTVLSRVHHQNLISLHGCTNRENRKLLLVYEFVSNGTLADHLHNWQSSKGSLSWDTRIRIAVETADAISYLHSLKPPIIHCDIKTDNILLDRNFTVKVADFGNCRRLSLGTVHAITMPQGTQGYMDPEFNHYFKLTDKSDVYSFGVVLLELISGKKALDLDRDADEIWLSNMALRKTKNKAIEQLVDPGLGYCSHVKMMWMVNLVAELALRCLRPKGSMRPPMMEVLMTLKEIRDSKIMGHDDASSPVAL